MATPTFISPPTTISSADATTGWTISGSAPTQDLEFKKEGSASNSGIMRNDLSLAVYTGTGISMANQHMRCWINFTATAFLDVEANNGMEFYVTDGTNTAYWVVFGSETYLGGWKNVIVNFEGTPKSGTKPTGNVTSWGFRFNRTAAPRQSINTWVDALRYGNGYTITGGTSGDKVTLANIYTLDAASAYGVLDRIEGVYFGYGKYTFGNGATTTYINFANSVLVFTNSKVAAGLYGLIGQGSGCNITFSGSVFQAGGSTDATRFLVNMGDANLAALSMTACLLTRAGACTFKSGQTVTGNTFDDCGQITAAGADMRNCIVKNYAGAANTSALIWDVATNPDGYLDNIAFTKGVNAHHAIEMGTTSPTTMTLRGLDFSGFNANNGQDDSVIHVKRTSGTVTISAIGCTGTVSYKAEGTTIVVIDVDPVTVLVNVKTLAGVDIQYARVLLKTSAAGAFPYNATVTISNSGTTATVAHTGHLMLTNDKVLIKGASLQANNGVFSITKTSDNEYTYQMTSTPGSSPTGTIKCWYVALYGETAANGNLSTSRVYSQSQPVTGWVRKSSAQPFYKEAALGGSVDSATGYTANVQMIPDE